MVSMSSSCSSQPVQESPHLPFAVTPTARSLASLSLDHHVRLFFLSQTSLPFATGAMYDCACVTLDQLQRLSPLPISPQHILPDRMHVHCSANLVGDQYAWPPCSRSAAAITC